MLQKLKSPWNRAIERGKGLTQALIQRFGGLFAIAWIGSIAAVVFTPRIFQLPIRASLNYNEGWNAYQAAHAFGPEALYPSLEATFSNNYPPLSFYVVGGLGQLIGDNIIAGRIISLLSLGAIALCIGWLVASRSKQAALGIFTGLFFLVTFGHYFSGYVAINDPQLLAHAVQMGALIWLMKQTAESNNRVSVVGPSLLIGVSLLIKHNLLALPAAIALWLFIHKRRAAFTFAALVTAIIATSFTLFHLIYGPDFLIGLLKAPRAYTLVGGLVNIQKWLAPQGWLVGLGLMVIARQWRNRDVQLIGLFAGFSVWLGVAIAGGAGINYNAVFDITISLCLLSGWALMSLSFIPPNSASKLHSTNPHTSWQLSEQQLAATLALSLIFILLLPTKLQAIATLDNTTRALATQAAEDVALISDTQSAVVCEELAMCYFAGKPLTLELFNFGQKLRAGLISEAEWIRKIEDREFSLLYLKKESRLLTDAVYQAIERHYEPFRTSTYRYLNYEFLRPVF